mmetsp:Transcript_4484/g.6584  ORF Transcript_4484/g.6584 Transcript_4484/m.6584 type:complete len:131 (+) Transcript_4484:47-439(+)
MFLNDYKYTIVQTVASMAVYKFISFYAGYQRGKANIKAPAVTGDKNFEIAFGIQRNTLESLPVYLTSLWLYVLCGGSDFNAGVAGGLWNVGRVLYFMGYPNKRSLGFGLGFLAETYLMGSVGYSAIKAIL